VTPVLSPYHGVHWSHWEDTTRALFKAHPLAKHKIVDVVLDVWQSIFRSSIGRPKARIGRDLFPRPQIMAFFLHELIPLRLAAQHPRLWRRDESAEEKDLVYVREPSLSVEIKASSHKSKVFGNRSYAQPASATKKDKSGYYLTVNFEKFSEDTPKPAIVRIRFGWLDHSDWIGQAAATGQQAHLRSTAEKYKLVDLYTGE